MSIIDNLEMNNLITESLPFFPEALIPSTDDVMFLSKRVDQLTIDVNTQNLKIELEKLKRCKLGNSLKQLRTEVISLWQVIVQQQAENNILKEQVATLSNTLFSELACLTSRTHCCLSRLHQILIAIVPYIVMPEGEHNENFQLLYELLRAAQMIRTVVQFEKYV